MTIIIISENIGQLCNTIKNLLSSIRIAKHTNGKYLIHDDNILINLFDLQDKIFINNNNYNENDNIIIKRYSWRLAIFDNDINLDKIIDNNFSLMFQDFNDHIFFKNYKNNCIDFIYKPELFNNIYEDYKNIFNNLIIKKNIIDEVNNFYNNNCNENTISVHLRSWVDCNDRKQYFNINNFYKKIDEYNNSINTFFISSDDINICFNIKKKYGNKIIIYENNSNTSLINAFINLLLLSKNNIIIGTFLSTYTELAYIINYNKDKKIYIL
jgi:hypothetical protein